MTEGLFGGVILFIMEVLPRLETMNLDISKLKWDISTNNYGSIFPNVLEYNSDIIESKDLYNISELKIINLMDLRGAPSYVLGDNFKCLNELFFKYFKIPEKLKNIVNRYNLNDHLGIHFRGTDKTVDNGGNNPISKKEFYLIIDSYIKLNKPTKIFLATDEKVVATFLKEKYSNIEFTSSREFTDNLFWRGNNDLSRHAEEAMIDMLCLSECKHVLKVSSALSGFCKVIKPNLDIYKFNALRMFADIPYFPDAYIPLLEKNSNYSYECNNILNKIQKDDWSLLHKERFSNFCYKIR